MIKRTFILISLIISILAVDSFAKKRTIKKKPFLKKKRTYLIPRTPSGLGISMGNEVGINLKYFMNRKTAYSGVFAQKSSGDEYNYFHVDRITHNHTFIENPAISIYYGVGLNTKLYDNVEGNTTREDNTYGVRFPFGVTYILRSFPVDFFAELTPTVILSPETELEFNFYTGARLWF